MRGPAKWNTNRTPAGIPPFQLPQSSVRPELKAAYAALEAARVTGIDDGYPPHDEDEFQLGYPRKGSGGYGSPGQF